MRTIFIQSHKAAGLLLCSSESSICCAAGQIGARGLCRGTDPAMAACGGGCRQLPPQTITHVAVQILHSGKREGVSCNTVTASAMRKAAGKGDPRLRLCQVCLRESCAFGQFGPRITDLLRKKVQLTRGPADSIAVAPICWLVALAALHGTGGSPLLAAQAAAAPRECWGVGTPQHAAHGWAGLPDGCCGDTTERCCCGMEKRMQMLRHVLKE